jgi:hypothetical protein
MARITMSETAFLQIFGIYVHDGHREGHSMRIPTVSIIILIW